MKDERQRRYWRANTLLVSALLAVWFVTGFVLSIVLVEPLNQFSLGGFPLGFWISQQGAILVFVALILVYCLVMDRLERNLGRDN
jgi:putative solute:sodium symporter small subunit